MKCFGNLVVTRHVPISFLFNQVERSVQSEEQARRAAQASERALQSLKEIFERKLQFDPTFVPVAVGPQECVVVFYMGVSWGCWKWLKTFWKAGGKICRRHDRRLFAIQNSYNALSH